MNNSNITSNAEANIMPREKKLKKLKEGNTEFYIHIEDKDVIPSKAMNVFYNEKMELNRDISILAVKSYSNIYNKSELTLVDAMAGSGIGSIRLLNETSSITTVYINDINPSAQELIKLNMTLNNRPQSKVHSFITTKDANLLFNEIVQRSFNDEEASHKKPEIISIDPFGTPVPYIDSAFKCITLNQGLLCITATDTPVLFGVRPKACLRKYMAKPLHNEFCKEIGARILLYTISRIANINKAGFLPLLTFYSNHFVRIFLLTYKSKRKIFQAMENYGYCVYCKHCGHRFKTPLNIINSIGICSLCGEDKLDYAGPLWIGELHERTFLEKISITIGNSESLIKHRNRISNLLQFCLDELHMPIGYFNIHRLCRETNTKAIPKMETLIDHIESKGHTASRTHFDFTSIKTTMDIISLKQLLKKLGSN
ncbi:MAG: tRNA (Guanine(26)-N(2)/guanine(27)-N(2))-dimethyltransferase [Promethearchaeota archaeon]|nr:MAG: tRNA (Guanine(26)-N(2)/guanine(27)-N(2))-dimethyltransferase [Candidatus Lokiarchaeota archaeon]